MCLQSHQHDPAFGWPGAPGQLFVKSEPQTPCSWALASDADLWKSSAEGPVPV